METFILSDESLNVYGTRVMTEGIELADFQKNPVMLLYHDRTQLPIGTWENIRREGNQLLADANFDMEDEMAKKVAGKVKRGILRAASIGFDVMAMDESEDYMLPGQTRPTISRARLVEASIVDIPANRNAIKLNFPKRQLCLDGKQDDDVVSQVLPTIRKMKNIATKLGLSADATETQIVDKIGELQSKLTGTEALANKSVSTLLALGRSKGVITDANQAHYKKLAAADFDATLALVEGATAPAPGSSHPEPEKETPAPPVPNSSITELMAQAMRAASQGSQEQGRESWTLTDWRKNDPQGLAKLQAEQPDKFNALLAKVRNHA